MLIYNVDSERFVEVCCNKIENVRMVCRAVPFQKEHNVGRNRCLHSSQNMASNDAKAAFVRLFNLDLRSLYFCLRKKTFLNG